MMLLSRMNHLIVCLAVAATMMRTNNLATAFVVSPTTIVATTSFSSSSLLFARVKRGKLGSNVEATATSALRNKKKSSTTTAKASNNKKGSSSSSGISPALAEWMQQSSTTSSPPQNDNDNDQTADAISATFTKFEEEKEEVATTKNTKRRRREKPLSTRKQADKERRERASVLVQQLQDLLEESNESKKEKKKSNEEYLQDVLSVVRNLMELQSDNLRQLTASAKVYDYRLAWVGSDDAVCHVGTGLHKVPLARLQEVFLTCQGRNRVELLEVIRILGPFPNVRNTIQGNCQTALGEKVSIWQITMTSMIDGTGKELLAGKEENERVVPLQVYFCDEQAIVAIVPPDEDDAAILRDDPLQDNGAHVMVFVREENLQDKLEVLRVA